MRLRSHTREHIRKSLMVGLGLGLGNTLLITAINGLLSKAHMGFIVALAVIGSLLFSALFFAATNDWTEIRLIRTPSSNRRSPRLIMKGTRANS
jgi:hypothetical protein